MLRQLGCDSWLIARLRTLLAHENLCQTHAISLANNHGFTTGNQAIVHVDIKGFSVGLAKFQDRAGPESQHLAYSNATTSQFDGYLDRYVHYEAQAVDTPSQIGRRVLGIGCGNRGECCARRLRLGWRTRCRTHTRPLDSIFVPNATNADRERRD